MNISEDVVAYHAQQIAKAFRACEARRSSDAAWALLHSSLASAAQAAATLTGKPVEIYGGGGKPK